MTDVFYKISRIALFAIMFISLIFLLIFYFGGAVEGTEGTTSYEPLITGKILAWSYVLLISAIGISLFFFLRNMLKDPKKLMNFALALGAVALIVFISFLFSSGELLDLDVLKYPDNNPGTLAFADTAIYTIYFLLSIAIAAIFYSELSKIKK